MFSVVTPVIPRKSTKVRYVSLLSSGDGVGIRSMKVEVGLGRHVVNPGSPLKALILEDYWGVRFLHVLPDEGDQCIVPPYWTKEFLLPTLGGLCQYRCRIS
jgi:hypothetical protein